MAIQSFMIKMPDMEVRKVDEVEFEIEDKVYRSLQVHFDDADCNRLVFKDKQVENLEKYKRGQIGTLTLAISTDSTIKTGKNGKPYITEKTTMTIHDFEVKNG